MYDYLSDLSVVFFFFCFSFNFVETFKTNSVRRDGIRMRVRGSPKSTSNRSPIILLSNYVPLFRFIMFRSEIKVAGHNGDNDGGATRAAGSIIARETPFVNNRHRLPIPA